MLEAMAGLVAGVARDEIIPRLVSKGDLRRADMLSRLVALDALHYIVERVGYAKLYRHVRRVTGGLGDTEDDPFDPFRMGLAGSVIAWPEAVRPGSRVLEIGTGLGRTRYAIGVTVETSLYVTIDYDPVILATALYRNPVPAYQDMLWGKGTIILLADAVRIVELLPPGSFDHIVHDGGPNPKSNPRLYTRRFLARLASLLRPGGTLSVFAGAERRWRSRIYESLVSLGFEVVETVHLPGSRAAVIHARLAGRAGRDLHHGGYESVGVELGGSRRAD